MENAPNKGAGPTHIPWVQFLVISIKYVLLIHYYCLRWLSTAKKIINVAGTGHLRAKYQHSQPLCSHPQSTPRLLYLPQQSSGHRQRIDNHEYMITWKSCKNSINTFRCTIKFALSNPLPNPATRRYLLERTCQIHISTVKLKLLLKPFLLGENKLTWPHRFRSVLSGIRRDVIPSNNF